MARHAGYIVTLEHPIHEEAAEPFVTALQQVRGVSSVQPIVFVADPESAVLALQRDRLLEAAKGVLDEFIGANEPALDELGAAVSECEEED